MLLFGAIASVLVVAGTGAAASSEYIAGPEQYAGAIPITTRTEARRSLNSGTHPRVTGIHRIRDAVEATESGDILQADGALREAMVDPSVRETARRMLHRLHRDPRLQLPVDDRKLSNTIARAGAPLQRYESKSFVLLCDAGPNEARQTLSLLERARHEMFRFTEQAGIPTVPHENKLVAISFADHDAFRTFASSEGLDALWAGGYYSAQSNHIVLFSETSTDAFMDATREIDEHSALAEVDRKNATAARQNGQHELANLLVRRADSLDEQISVARSQLRDYANESKVSKAIHEAAHLLSFNIGLQRTDRVWPFWLSEGIATAFETNHARQSFGPGIKSEAREAELNDLIANKRTMPYSKLITALSAPSHDAEEAGRMYAQSYGLFTHLANTDADALTKYIQELSELRLDPSNETNTRRVLLHVFEKHFGPPNVVQRRVERSGRGR